MGKNGAGKSTLFKVIVGSMNPDAGSVSTPKEFRIGYLPQEMDHASGISVFDETSKAFSHVQDLQERIDVINDSLANRTDYESEEYMELINEVSQLNDLLHAVGGSSADEEITRVLQGLGFALEELERPMETFSGGWQMRVELAKILLQFPDLLLLDEPTNHLDIESIQWLEDFLKQYHGSIMMISHDRTFLDTITSRTIEIANSQVYDYKAPYSKYLLLRQEAREKLEQAYKNQQREIAHTEQLINKFRAKKNKAAFAQTLIRKLDKMERVELDEQENASIRFRFPPAPRSGNVVLQAKDLAKQFDGKQVLNGLEFKINRGDKIALLGKNGIGKTTLLKMIVGELNHQGKVELGHNVTMGYYAQNQSEELDTTKTVFETIDDEAVGDVRTQVRGLLGSFLFSGETVDKKVSVLSGGEKARLALCKLLLSANNFLVLDEPTNHLDIRSKDILKNALKEFQGTLLVVSHDRDFLDSLTDQVFEISERQLKHSFGTVFDFISKHKHDLPSFAAAGGVKKESKPKEESTKELNRKKKEEQKARRNAMNKLKRLEEMIASLESELETLQEEIDALDYSDQTQASKVFEQFESKKEELDIRMAEWEELANKYEDKSN